MENYYEVLKVANFADEEVIKASYKALSKKYHPDINKEVDPNIMVRINQAYEVLGNTELKEKYDLELKKYLNNQESQDSQCEKYYSKSEIENGNRALRSIRIIVSIVITIVIGGFLGDALALWLNGEGSWGFIIYTISGALMGKMFSKISGCKNEIIGIVVTIIIIICLLSPYYYTLSVSLPLIYGEMNLFAFAVVATREIFDFLILSGFIRMMFVLFTPIAIYGAIVD